MTSVANAARRPTLLDPEVPRRAGACPPPFGPEQEPQPEQEHKVVADPLPLARFLRAVGPHVVPVVYDARRPVQYTRTTYLDTDDLAYTRSGDPGPRVRLRIREYAAARGLADEPVLTGLCFLELKQSAAGQRRKVRWSAPAALVRTLVASHGMLLADVGAPAELVERLRRDRPAPVVTTWYRRRSLASPEGVRITIDDAVCWCPPVPAGAPGLLAAPKDPGAALPEPILEVKLAGERPAWLAEAMRDLPASLATSKFELAMRARGQGR